MTTANALAALVNSSSQVVVPSGGINFGTTTSGTGTPSSGLLDDYEEGTWTPVPENNDGSDLTNNDSVGWYRKVGKLVWVQGWVKFSATPTNTTSTACRISNFPFENISTDSGPSVYLRFYGTRPSSKDEWTGYYGTLYSGSLRFFKFYYNNNGTITSVKTNNLAADSNIIFSFIYSNG